MLRKLILTFPFYISVIANLHAGCLACGDAIIGPNDEFPIVWTKVIMLSGGPGWTTAGKTQQQFTTESPLQFNTYVANKKTNTLGEGELYFALQHTITNCITGRLGVAAAGSSPAKLQGSVLINSNPNQRNYTYSYEVAHGRITFKGMLLFDPKIKSIMPYLMGSFGLGMNASHQYKQVPTSSLIPEVPTFTSNTVTVAFAYTSGAGIEVSFTQNWHGGLGYQFADWGKSNLNGLLSESFDKGLRLSHLYTHLLQFSLIYVC